MNRFGWNKRFVGIQLLRKVVMLSLGIAIARTYSVEEFGKISLFIITALLLVMILDFGVSTFSTRHLSRTKENPVAILSKSFQIKIVMLVILLLIFFLWKWFGFRPLVPWSVPCVVLAFSDSMTLSYFGILRSQQRFAQEAMITLMNTFLIGVIVGAIMLCRLDIGHIVFGLTLASIICLVFLSVWEKHWFLSRSYFAFDILNNLFFLKRSFSFFAIAMSFHFAMKLDSLVMKSLVDFSTFASYEVSASFFKHLIILPHSISIIFYPRFAGGMEKNGPLLFRMILIVSVISISLIIFQLVLSDWLILTIFTSKYQTSIRMLELLSFSILPLFLNIAFCNVLSAIGKNLYSIIVYFMISITTILLGYFFVINWGVVGMAYAIFSAQMMALAVGAILIQRQFALRR